MAIIIDNLNLPNTCTMCWISNICQEHIHDLNHIGYEKRLDDCPLRELVRCKDCSNWDIHWVSSLFSENVHCCAFIEDPCNGEFYCGAAVKRQVLGGDKH